MLLFAAVLGALSFTPHLLGQGRLYAIAAALPGWLMLRAD
jgi:hypothetical protein